MRVSFFEFNVAASALHTSRAFMNTTGHNIANAELPGYSRQQVQAQAGVPLSLRDGRGMYGTGSIATGVIQMRDRFMDQRFWHQRAVQGEFISKASNLQFVETVFNNLPDAGVLRIFNDFFAKVADLTSDAPSPTPQINVITGGESLAELIRNQALTLQRQQLDINREVSDTVTIINSLGTQLANLNRQIFAFERDGSNANDLRDQRNLLIDQLSQIVNVSVVERDFSTEHSPNDRRTFIQINGHDFVNHTWHEPLEVVARTTSERRNEMDADGLFDLRFSNGIAFNIYHPALQGTLKGLIDVRDGNHSHITESEIPTWPRGFDPSRPGEWAAGWTGGIPTGWPTPQEPIVWPKGFDVNNPQNWTGGWATNPPPPFNINDPTSWPRGTIVHSPIYPPGTNPPVGFDPSNPSTWGANWVVFSPSHSNTWPIGTRIEQGTTTNFKGIPFYMNQLNHLTRVFVSALNEGIDANGDPINGATGHAYGFDTSGTTHGQNRRLLFFTFDYDNNTPKTLRPDEEGVLAVWLDANGNRTTDHTIGVQRATDSLGNPLYTLDTSRLNALNIMVNPDLKQNPSWLATSSEADLGQSNNDIMTGWNTIATKSNLFREGRIVDFIVSTSDHLAIDLNQSRNFQISYQEMILHTHNQRLATMGVDINEEMMDLVRFQSMFIAASKMINVIETVYDTLINRTGAF